MKLKTSICAIMALLLCFVSYAVAGGFEKSVAKVGETPYATIDEAIDNWGNNQTLTLLANVTLSDVVKLKSTEHHILNLGTYTMTAATGKNAIEITCEGRSSASYALTVNADATNPGGITATGKSCIYYKKSDTTKDRPIILINNGVFTGSYSINSISNGNTNCPQIWIYGGIFNSYMNLTKNMLRISGGTFHAAINATGDSSAYREISGGRFKSWQFMTADAPTKFWVGSGNGNYNVGVYVDKEGYLCVGGPVITELSAQYPAKASNYSKWSSYLKYSSAAANGLYYEDPDAATKKHGESNVTFYEHVEVVKELDNNAAVKDFTPELPAEVKTFEVEAIDIEATAEATTKVTFNVEPKNASGQKVSNPSEAITFRLPVPAAWAGKQVYVSHDGTRMDGKYTVQSGNYVEVTSASFSEFAVEPVPPVAKIGDVEYATLAAAVEAAQAGDEIVIIADVELAETIEFPADKTITLNLNDKTISAADKNVVKNSGAALTIKSGTIKRTGTVAGYAVNVVSGTLEVEDVTIVGGLYTSGTSLVATNTNISQASASRHAIYAYNCAVTINSGTYHNNNAGNATIFAYGSSVITIEDGTFSIDNGKQTFGWTSCMLDANAGGKFVINGGTFKGHFRVQANSAMEINGGTFENTHNEAYAIYGTAVVKGGTFTDAAAQEFAKNNIADDYKLGEDGKVVYVPVVAKIGETKYETLDAALAAATEGQTITMLVDATPALTSQRAITKAAVIDLGGKTMTLTEDDLYFGTTTFKNGTIVVDPSVKPSTAVFWMFANQTLTFDNVKIVATGVTGTYLIGLEGENSDLNLLNGSEILVENTTALDLDIICVNGTNTCDIKVENSK
ncbi:MAG: hypothetical protein IKT83_00035, partial [Bacteroidaceae bacterium]|nr:hypothetical protein [Bacteroidaceae bacterium]